MNKFMKFALCTVFTVMIAGNSEAAKWKELVFTDDINSGLAELTQYCMSHNVTVADVLWANSVESADIKAGQKLFLPANHADMLSIWQHKGAWQPTALVPVTSAAAAKRASNKGSQLKEVPMPKIAGIPDLNPAPTQPVTPEPVAVQPEPVKPAPVQPVNTAKKTESPAKVISNTAKPDKILTSNRKKSAKPQVPGLMDPIIIFSPNGDPSKGPMRLVISGDRVEVVQLPKSAAPKRPSLSDLNNSFGTNPRYLPHYNLTPKARDPFILNMGNLKGKMLWPVDGKVSSPFGKWRGSHKHQGIDIPMPAGTPIRAARNGVVSRTGNNSTMGFRGYGNFVLMDHGEGVQTFYAHCLSVAVVQGQRVMQGQIVGYVGSTGRSTANHLHFEVRVNNAKVDPVPYLAGNTSLASNK